MRRGAGIERACGSAAGLWLGSVLRFIRSCGNMDEMDTLYILDGMALLYRAFYAFINTPMRTVSGLNTSAVLGFTNTLLALSEKRNPSHIVVCMDPSGPTFRHEMYAEYKANRQAMPQELRESIPLILEILAAMRIRVARVQGFEADDIIGTLTRQVDEMGGTMRACMVSGDKDLGQLLSANCTMLKPGKRGNDFDEVDSTAFCTEWGITSPSQIIDILALMGDSADNIPGIPGVGAVTARKLIAQFGNFNNFLAHTAEIKGKLREKVEKNIQLALLSYRLATIRRDVPLPFSPADCVRTEPDVPALREILERLEFHGMVKRLGLLTSTNTPNPPTSDSVQGDLFAEQQLRDISSEPHSYRIASTCEERSALARKLLQAPRWALNIKTTGTDPLSAHLLGISFCLQPHEVWFVPVEKPEDLQVFAEAFVGSALKIGFNLKFDFSVLRHIGTELSGPFFDVMLAHCALYPQLRHGLDEMSAALLAYRTIRHEESSGTSHDASADVPPSAEIEYSSENADVTLQLADVLAAELRQAGLTRLMEEVEFPLIPVLAEIELCGMRLEPSLLEQSDQEISARINELSVRIESMAGHPINLNSPQQVGELLFSDMRLLAKPKKTRTGQFVTDEETLRRLVHLSPIVSDILEFRELSKLKGTYIDALPRFISPADGRIHSSLLQMVTSTGRLASQSPNLQNIPVRSGIGRFIRRAFVARGKGWSILSADYSQVELRVMSALSADPALVEAFAEGRDVHAETAARIYGVPHSEVTTEMRRNAKTVNFGIMYGISAFGLSQRLTCSRSEASALIESYFKQFPRVKQCMDELIERARRTGYAETLCGRRRYLPDLAAANFNLRAAAERNAINTPIQGTAADMIKLAMVRVAQLLRPFRSQMIMQIHDELLFDLWDEEADSLIPAITQTMQQALPLPGGVPLIVETGRAANWLDAH